MLKRRQTKDDFQCNIYFIIIGIATSVVWQFYKTQHKNIKLFIQECTSTVVMQIM